jgi:hypothetical protein
VITTTRTSETFPIPLGVGVAITARRLESWEWEAAEAASISAGRKLRQGAVVIEQYGFEGEEFEALASPENWEGMSKYIFAVELGCRAIVAWDGFLDTRVNPPVEAPVNRAMICTFMRMSGVMRAFLHEMNVQGGGFLEEIPEGNRLFALGEWEYSGGGEHCADCRKLGRRCADGLPGETGELCERTKNEPETPEGRAAKAIAEIPGVWSYAGLGALAGLNWPAAQAQMPSLGAGLEWRRVSCLLRYFERGALSGYAKRPKKTDKQED